MVAAVSPRKRQANRLNAQKSTGPKTEQGKARCARNSFKHGIFARDIVIEGEDPAEFREHRNALLIRLNPRDAMELELIEQIIAAGWKIKRVRAAEKKLYHHALAEALGPQLEEREKNIEHLQFRVQSYQEDADRARKHRDEYLECRDQAAAELEQAEASLWEGLPQVPPGELLANMMRDEDHKALERLHRCEQRLEYSRHRCLRELRLLRKDSIDDEPTELTSSLLDDDEQDNSDTGFQPVPEAGEDESLQVSEHPARAGSPCHGEAQQMRRTEPVSVQAPAGPGDAELLRETPAVSQVEDRAARPTLTDQRRIPVDI